MNKQFPEPKERKSLPLPQGGFMPCYIWSSIQAIRSMQSYAIQGKGELRVINVSRTVRDDVMHIKVLNWNSLQGNHQGRHHTHCTRPQAELWTDCKEWSLPGYNKKPNETVSSSYFVTKYWHINDYCMMGRRQNKMWSWKGGFVEYRAAKNAWCSWVAIISHQVRSVCGRNTAL